MERWTIPEPQAGRYRLHINFGGPGFWCMFDYAARPDPAVEGIAVAVGGSADPDTADWFPHLKRGMDEGWRTLRDDFGRVLTGVRVVVTKVHTHPVATTARGCEYYGSEFVLEFGRYRAVPSAAEPGP